MWGAHPRVVALVTDAFGGRGGIAQYNRDFLRALAACGMAVSIRVLPRHAADRVVTPAGIDQASARPGRVAYAIVALFTSVRHRADIVFCGHLYLAPLAWVIARLTGAKFVLQMHGVEAWPRPSRLRRAAVEAADLVLCVSRHTRSAVVGWATIAPERALVVPNTVEDAFAPGESSALRNALGLEGRRVLLTVGRMDAREHYKGHDRIIRALPELVRRGHDVVYVSIGEGADRVRLEELAKDFDVAERVRFLGAVSQETVVQAYRMADLYVMPSTGEGFGIAFLEAMASGTPALGLGVTGARDALADGELGTVVSEAELSGAIARLLAAPRRDPAELRQALRARFGREAFARSVYGALARVVPTGLDATAAGRRGELRV